MSAEFQIFFKQPPSRVKAEYTPSTIPARELEERLAEARAKAADDLRQHYDAQISDMRSEAVEFHQQLVGRIEAALADWSAEWERQVPSLILIGVRAVLADFKLTDEQLSGWVHRALEEVGATDRSEFEIQLSPHNVQRLAAFWEDNGISLPGACFLSPVPELSEVDCRVAGRSGILDASLPNRLSQLRRLWKLAP